MHYLLKYYFTGAIMFTNICYVQIEELDGIFYINSLPPEGEII